jgi:peptide/nickel transport system substrate-binding protein
MSSIPRRPGASPFAINRRTFFAGGAALAIGAGFGFPARAQEERVLKIAHLAFEREWSPIRGGGWYAAWNSFWWASALRFDAEGKLHPYVFKTWSSNDDRTVWTFEIDPAAIFSDGSAITPADIKGGWELNSLPETKNQRVNQFLSGVDGYAAIVDGSSVELPGVVITGERSLEVRLTAPDPVFDQKIATHLLPVLKIQQARGEDGREILDWWNTTNGVVTSGPFKPVKFDLNAGEVEFEPNPNFFGPKPRLTRVIVKSIEDPVLQTALLQRGEYHAVTTLRTPTLIEDLGKSFAAGPASPVGNHFWLNVSREPTNDPLVRQALILAVDRQGLIDASYPRGPQTKADQILTGVPGVDPAYEPYPYDPAKAKQLLAQSSYGGPERLPRLGIVGVSTTVDQLAAQFIVEQWRKNLGITAVDLKPQYNSYAGADQESIQIFRDDVASRVPDATSLLRGSIHSVSSNAKLKLGGYHSQEVDTLLDQAAVLPLDDPQRDLLAQKAQRVFRDDWAFIPWIHNVTSKFAIDRVQGFERNLDNQIVEPWSVNLV